MFRIAVCDDELSVCSNIENIILDFSKESCEKIDVDVYNSGEGLYDLMLNGQYYDLIFLDIELKLLNGIEVGMKIRNALKNEITQIVYISAKQGYAMGLFEIRPLNFLVKPLNKEKIIQCLKKAMDLFARNNQFYEFNIGKTYYKVPFKDIIFFESEGKKVSIITIDGIKQCYGKLSDIEKSVPNRDFLLIHKSYLVNYLYVTEYQYESLRLTNGEELSISQTYRKDIRDKLLSRRKGRK